jgi:hypothetical protein
VRHTHTATIAPATWPSSTAERCWPCRACQCRGRQVRRERGDGAASPARARAGAARTPPRRAEAAPAAHGGASGARQRSAKRERGAWRRTAVPRTAAPARPQHRATARRLLQVSALLARLSSRRDSSNICTGLSAACSVRDAQIVQFGTVAAKSAPRWLPRPPGLHAVGARSCTRYACRPRGVAVDHARVARCSMW